MNAFSELSFRRRKRRIALLLAFLVSLSSFVNVATGIQLQPPHALKQFGTVCNSAIKKLGLRTSQELDLRCDSRKTDMATAESTSLPSVPKMATTPVCPGMVQKWDTNFWLSNVSWRLMASGSAISVITIDRTVPQAVRTSNGVLPQVPRATLNKLISSQLAKQSLLKTMQFYFMRECKLTLQSKTGSDASSTMIAYGLTGVPFQSLLYNLMISDTYTYFGKSAGNRGAMQLMRETVLPGIFWCFIRESCATGGGLFLGGLLSPKVQAFVNEQTGHKSQPGERPNFGVRFVTGVTCGGVCALATQWLNENILKIEIRRKTR